MRLSLSVIIVGAFFVWNARASGQPVKQIEGVVLDQSGGPISGAKVILFSVDRVRTTTTSDSGEFKFADLAASAPYIEVAANGFFTNSVAITEATAQPLKITLHVGEGSQCTPISDAIFPSAYYGERSGKLQLTGSVVAYSGPPLSHAALTLKRSDLDSPVRTGYEEWGRVAGLAMRQRSFKETTVAQVRTNENGEFQFEDLEPGWYSLTAAHDGYYIGILKFWIARQNLTKTAQIHLLPKGATGCPSSIFGPDAGWKTIEIAPAAEPKQDSAVPLVDLPLPVGRHD